MRRFIPLVPVIIVATSLWVRDAQAQFGPPGGGGGGGGLGPGGPPSSGQPQQEQGPAEAAPERSGQEPALTPLPAWPGMRDKALQFFQLNGYIRARTYLFYNGNLGVPLRTTGPSSPFYTPYSETDASGTSTLPGNPASCAARRNRNCRTRTFTSTDMRMRLEPTINVSEQVRVKAQFDVFDNYVLGSTPEGFYLNGQPSTPDLLSRFFARANQVAPEAGRNSFENAIRVKRAWAEVRLPIGELRFGRMPSHWGLGLQVNNGDCLDCDYGVNVDRVMFVTREPWAKHFFAFLWDWAATGPTTRLYTPNQSNGPVYNADRLDDVMQWGLAVGKQDKPEDLKEKLEKGELIINYGGYFTVRYQSWDLVRNPGVTSDPTKTGGVLGQQTPPNTLSDLLTPRNAWAFVPDLWFRLDWRRLHLEAEWVIVGGRVNNVSDLTQSAIGRGNGYTILQYGGVLRTLVRLLRNKQLFFGLELGYASGDGYEDPNARLNFREARIIPPSGATLSNFRFDPDYHVDLLLYRRILGTVSNATYFKGTFGYDITESFIARADIIYSLANRPVAYPGNSTNLGVELDAQLMYRNEKEGFYFGLAYGVLFPFRALSLPAEIFGSTYAQNPSTAQTVQARVVVKF